MVDCFGEYLFLVFELLIGYIAPEVIQKKEYGKSVDWYLLGVLFYELLTGIIPFYSTNVEEMFRNIQRNELKIHKISSNALQSFNNTTEIKNQRYKIKTIDSIHNNLINDNKIYNKGKTQSESFWPYKKNNYIKSYLNKIRKKIEKKKSFKTERTKDNKIIYYNSSIEDKYNNKKKNKIFESGLNNINLGKSASNFKSDDVNFIHKKITI